MDPNHHPLPKNPAEEARLDELGAGSLQLEREVRERVAQFQEPKRKLGIFGSVILALFTAIIGSIIISALPIGAVASALIYYDYTDSLTDLAKDYGLETFAVVAIATLFYIVSKVESIKVREGQVAYMSLFGGWLLKPFLNHFQISQGEHIAIAPFVTYYVMNLTVRTMEVEVKGATCKGVGGIGQVTLGDGNGGGVKMNPMLRLVDPLEKILRGQEGDDAVGLVVTEFTDNAFRDGITDLRYNQVERAGERDRAVIQLIRKKHGLRRVLLADGDEVFLITGSGYALTALAIQACLANDPAIIESRASASIAAGKAAALKVSTKAVKAAGPDIENAMIFNGELSGEEVRMIRLGLNGITGDQAVEISKNLGGAAQIAAPFLGSRGGRGGRRQRRRNQGGGGGQHPPAGGNAGHH